MDSSDLVQARGVLHIRTEYHQELRGLPLSLLIKAGGTSFQPLTTTYDWWIDAENPWRSRTIVIEQLPDGPSLVRASGSDGDTSWWKINAVEGITQPQRHAGRFPIMPSSEVESNMTLSRWITIFSREGDTLVRKLEKGEAREVDRTSQSPWGIVLHLQTRTKQGHSTLHKVRAEAPHIGVERIHTDKQGNLVETYRFTQWEWMYPEQLEDGFWMNPPNIRVPLREYEIKVGA